MMSPWLLAIVAAIYIYVCYDLYMIGKYGLALAFFAYAISNIGFIWEAIR